jgi:hypothetical protein
MTVSQPERVKAVLPTHALTIPHTGSRASHNDGWVYERKVYCWRMLAYKDGDRVRLIRRIPCLVMNLGGGFESGRSAPRL